MVNEIKKKDAHIKAVREAADVLKNRTGSPHQDAEDAKTVSDEISEVMSHLLARQGNHQSEQEKQAEAKALQAFLVECEKRKIMTLPILKNIQSKNIKFVNEKMDPKLLEALVKFLAAGIGGGLVINALTLAQNNLQDEQLARLLHPLGNVGAKTKSLVFIKNPIGPAALSEVIRIITPEPCLHNEVMVTRNRHLQELILNDSKFLKSDMLS
jgi:hypothetical protein